MRVDREEFLKVLESVSPGLSSREILEQSSCFVFVDGKVITFNDEVACSRKTPIDLVGAVKAKPILDLLSKLTENELDIEQKEGELLIKAKQRKRSGIRMEADVLLPVESIDAPEIEGEGVWKELPDDFAEAVRITSECASREESQFVLTCIHIHTDYLEACDRFQIARYPMEVGLSGSVLIRATSLKKIVGLGMTDVAETESWLHFKNPTGLVLSCRKYIEEYKDLGRFISNDGMDTVTFPGGLDEMVQKAEIFSSDNISGNHVTVDLRPDRIVIEGEGSSGWYKEIKKVKFSGKPLRFLIAPKLLVEISKKSNECRVAEDRLYIDGGVFQYATSTVVPDGK